MKIRQSAGLQGGVLAIAAIVAHATFSYALAPATLTWLGAISGDTTSQAYNISADGSVVVGASYQIVSSATASIHKFRWTSATGMISIGDLPGGSVRSNAYAVSADGTTIVGSSSSRLGGDDSRAGTAGFAMKQRRWCF